MIVAVVGVVSSPSATAGSSPNAHPEEQCTSQEVTLRNGWVCIETVCTLHGNETFRDLDDCHYDL